MCVFSFNFSFIYITAYVAPKPTQPSYGPSSNNSQTIDLSQLRQLSDDQLRQLEAYIQFEKESRKVRPNIIEASDAHAIEIRKGMKRSKSGGMEMAFQNRFNNHHYSLNCQRKIHHDALPNVDTEDLEVGSLFDNVQSVDIAGTTSSPIGNCNSGSIRVISRSSGAFHPNDKMFGISPNHGAPSPAAGGTVHGQNVSSPANFASGSPGVDVICQSQSNQSQRPPSRLASRFEIGSEEGVKFKNT